MEHRFLLELPRVRLWFSVVLDFLFLGRSGPGYVIERVKEAMGKFLICIEPGFGWLVSEL